MPFNPEHPDDIARLRRSIRTSITKMQPYRDNRKVILNRLHDPCHISDNPDTDLRIPRNPMDRMFRILTRGVVDQYPSLRIVRSRQPRVAGMVRSMLDDWSRKENLSEILQSWFQESLLRWGICYTGYEHTNNGREPFADPLEFDDYFIDVRGTEEDKIDFEGHEYGARIDDLRNDQSLDQSVVESIAKTQSKNPDGIFTLYDWTRLIHVYLPRERLKLTLGNDKAAEKRPLRIQDYDGPSWSPYLRFRLTSVPSNIIPSSRMSMLYDMSEFVVRTYRQAFVQANRTLEAFAYPKGSERDAQIHRTLLDGEYAGFENPDAVKAIRKGGVDSAMLNVGIHADGLFDEDADNLKLIGGSGPSADTLGQERIIAGQVGVAVEDMRARAEKMAKRLYDTVAYYRLTDPMSRGMIEWTSPAGNRVTSEWGPEIAAGVTPDDLGMEIVPGSTVSRSASAQLSSLVQTFDILAKAAALPGEDTMAFKHKLFREKIADYLNQPEIAELFEEVASPSSVQPGPEAALQFGQGLMGGGGGAPNMNPSQSGQMMPMVQNGRPPGNSQAVA